MTVLVDTGVLYADHDRDVTRHEADTPGGFARDGPIVGLLR